MADAAEPKPVLRRWEDTRRTIAWHSPDDTPWGVRAGGYAPIESPALQARIARIPAGQGLPLHRMDADQIIVQLAGELDFTFGGELRVIKPYDMLVLPANAPYEWFNPGFEDALFFVVHDFPPAGQPHHAVSHRLDPAEEGWDVPAGLEIQHLAWEDYRRKVHWRGGMSEIYGYHRGVYPIVETATMRGHPVRVPAGQGSPWKTVPGDGIFVGMRGEVELYGNSFTETDAYPLGPLDLLMMPGPIWALQNPGLEDAVYFSVSAKKDTPFTMTYFQPAEAGNPLAGPGDEHPV